MAQQRGGFRVISEEITARAPPPAPESIQADIGQAATPIVVGGEPPVAAPPPAKPAAPASPKAPAVAKTPDKSSGLGRVPRQDGRYSTAENPAQRSYENPEGLYDERWLKERLDRIARAGTDPYYKLVSNVAGRTGRTVLELVREVVPVVTEAEQRERALLEAVARQQQQPQAAQLIPPSPGGSMGDDVDVLQEPAVKAEPESAPNKRMHSQWINHPENLGRIVFNETMLAGLDQAMDDIRNWSQVTNVSLHQFVISPAIQSQFYKLVASIIRINEIGTPRRNEHPHILLPRKRRDRLNALEAIKQVRVNPYDPHGEVSVEGDMARLVLPMPPWGPKQPRRGLTRDQLLHHPSLSYEERRKFARTGEEQLRLDQDEVFNIMVP
jgi:hypothetical protein